MKSYICKKCGKIIETDDINGYICENCKNKEFDIIEDKLDLDEIDEIIGSVMDDSDNNDLKIINPNNEKKVIISSENKFIYRIEEKCTNCGQCKKICEKKANISYELSKIKNPICIGCGQCALYCPSKAINIVDDSLEVKRIIDENQKIVICILDPAVVAYFNTSEKYNDSNEKKLIGALKNLGFDYVFNMAYGTDLYVIEESANIINKLKNKSENPVISSFCPAFIEYVNNYNENIKSIISSSKNPLQMQANVIKKYFCNKKELDSSKVVIVAVTTCVAHKKECNIENSNLDCVLTTKEIENLLLEENINLNNQTEINFDDSMMIGSGSGYMVSTSGGLSEAIVRTLYKTITKKNIHKDYMKFDTLRSSESTKKSIIKMNNINLKVAVIQSLDQFEKIINSKEYKKYDYIEVMTCENGCICGGGQNISMYDANSELIEKMKNMIYEMDEKNKIRCSHDNSQIKKLYSNYLLTPLSEESKINLHNKM